MKIERWAFPGVIAILILGVFLGFLLKNDIEGMKNSLLTAAGLREILQTNDDALQSIDAQYRVGKSLNEFFNGVTSSREGLITADLDKYWTAEGLTVGPGSIIKVVTRKTFEYPILMAWIKLLPPNPDYSVHLGVNAGTDAGAGVLQLASETGAPYSLYLGVRADNAILDVQDLLPPGYDQREHTYILKLNRYGGELWIDQSLKAVILQGLWEELPRITGVPYALAGTRRNVASNMSAYVELNPQKGGPYTLKIDGLNGDYFVAANGDSSPPRQFALFNEHTNVRWAGQAISAKAISHPIPIWGYTQKTLLFQATGEGTLDIRVYAGGDWRLYKSVPVAANALVTENIDHQAPLVRYEYTPGASQTVKVAEVNLN